MAVKLFLDTTSPVCRLWLIKGGVEHYFEREVGRDLARTLLGIIFNELEDINASIQDISMIGVLRGPGSFTGIRIGLSFLNTIASENQIPIVGAIGDNWREECLSRLENGENDNLVMPFYDRPVNITTPRK